MTFKTFLRSLLFFSAISAFGYTNYAKHPEIDPMVWETMRPYFLPTSHPIKKKLDRLFSKSRILLNQQAVALAGFKTPVPTGFTHTIVSKHPKLKGYFVKMYTDDQQICDWCNWKKRIDGAKIIRDAIERHQYAKYFKVPKKWVYPLPLTSHATGAYRKDFVLIAEDMDIYPNKGNVSRWKSMKKKRLKAIFTLMNENGLDDSGLASNLPFSYDGTQAFVDTERAHQWPIDFKKTERFLSEKMKLYWIKLSTAK